MDDRNSEMLSGSFVGQSKHVASRFSNTLKRLTFRKPSESGPLEVIRLLDGLKNVYSAADNYLERYKLLSIVDDSKAPNFTAENASRQSELYEQLTKRRKSKKNLSNNLKLKIMEHLIEDFKDYSDFQVHQVEMLLGGVIKTHMSILKTEGNPKNLFSRSSSCVDEVLQELLVDDYLPSSTVRSVFKIIQDKYFWQMKQECLHLIMKLCDRSRNQSSCLMYIMERMHIDYEFLAESADILKTLLLIYKPESLYGGRKHLVELCCQLYAECDPKKTEIKTAIEGCLTSLVIDCEPVVLPLLALQTVRVSIGPYRSDIADLLYNLCKDRKICLITDLVGPLILMLEDRDPDVVIRGYHIFTQLLSPPIACLYQIHSTDNFFSYAEKITNDNQTVSPFETLQEVKNEIKQIILYMLICYIRHSIYPKTLEALLIFNCTVIIEIKDPLLLPRITSFLLNLQEAALSILPIKTMRQSFMQWAVTHLFLLVADVYSISSLKDYVYDVINQRKVLAPFLLFPIFPSSVDMIPSSCLMEKQQVNIIIDNWNELVEPTRTLHESTPSSSLSHLSAWGDFASEL